MQRPTLETASLMNSERTPGWMVAVWEMVSSVILVRRDRSMIHPSGPIVDQGLLPPDFATKGIL